MRAEREGGWALQIETVPFFFAAKHTTSLDTLSPSTLKHFLNGNHIVRHNSGLWTDIESDMWKETTFMIFGLSQGGVIVITLRLETLKTWVLGLLICSRLELDLEKFS